MAGLRAPFALMLAVVVSVSLALTLLSPVPAEAAKKKKKWAPTQGAFFNVPRSTPAAENRLENETIAAIRNTPKGAEIKMVMFSYDRWQVTNALLEAKRRGVWIQVILNKHELTPAARALKDKLGARTKKVTKKKRVRQRPDGSWVHRKVTKTVQRRQFFYQCVSACRGDGDVQHSKFVLFSQTGTAKNVTMLGSLNMKENGTHNQFNDLLVLNGHQRLYRDLDKIFGEMRKDRALKKSYRDYVYGPNKELFVLPFPRKLATKKTEWTPARDPMTKLLKPIKCLGAATPSGRTAIRVNMHAWDKQRGVLIANMFRDLYAKGCDVKILVGFAGGDVQGVFKRPTGRGIVPIRSTGFDTDDDGIIDLYSHTKYFTVNGNYGNKKNTRMIVTGSSNYQNGGQYGDELILKMVSPTLHTQYINNWNSVWKDHTHGFSWGGHYSNGLNMMGRGVNNFADDLRAPNWRAE